MRWKGLSDNGRSFRGEFDETDSHQGRDIVRLTVKIGSQPPGAGGDWTTNSDVAFVAFPPFLIWP